MKKLLSVLAVVLMLAYVSIAEDSTPIVSIGAYSDDVVAVLTKLNELGLLNQNPNSPFNSMSMEALKTLQIAMGCEATGLIDRQNELNTILDINTETGLGNVLHNTNIPQLGKSDYANGVWRSASNGKGTREIIKATDFSGSIGGFHIVGTSEDEKYTEVAIDNVPVIFGAKYTLSCYAKGTGHLTIQHGRKPYIRRIFEVNGEWQQYSAEFTIGYKDGSTPAESLTNVYFGVPKGAESDIIICGMKLEADIASLAVDRNILNNSELPQIGKSDFEKGVWRVASSGKGIRETVEIMTDQVKDIKSGIHIVGFAEDTKNTDVAIDGIPMICGAKYILSCYAKGTGQISLQYGKKPYQRETFDVTDEWQYYSMEFTLGVEDGSTVEEPMTNVYFGVPKGINSDIIICGMSLVKK